MTATVELKCEDCGAVVKVCRDLSKGHAANLLQDMFATLHLSFRQHLLLDHRPSNDTIDLTTGMSKLANPIAEGHCVLCREPAERHTEFCDLTGGGNALIVRGDSMAEEPRISGARR